MVDDLILFVGRLEFGRAAVRADFYPVFGLVHFSVGRLGLAADGAALQPPRLIVFEILQLQVVDPGVKPDAAVTVLIIRDVLRHQILCGRRLVAGLKLRLRFALFVYVNAVPLLDVGFGLRQLEDDVIHILDAGEYAVLRHDFARVEQRYRQLSDGAVGAARVVPFYEPECASLERDGPLGLVVELLERHPVKLVAEHVLDELRLRLVAFFHGRDLRLRYRRVYLRL